MTVLMSKPSENYQWASMPGWGLVADLTPPEIVEARHLVKLRRYIAGAVVLVLALCIGGYVHARQSYDSAQQDSDAASARTSQLTVQEGRYSRVTEIKGVITSIHGQIASLMGDDVDTGTLVGQLMAAMPKGMAASSINVSFVGTDQSDEAVPTAAASGIGTVEMTGTAHALDDLATYAEKLASLRGVSNVIPTSNVRATRTATTWALTLTLTDRRYSHRFGTPAVAAPITPNSPVTSTGGN